MPSIRVQRDASPVPPDAVACMGAFDGLHLGHQGLFAAARKRGGEVVVVTFDPHPLQIVAPDRAPRMLQTAEQRARVAGWLGLDRLVVLPFDHAMASLSPEGFVSRFITDGLHPSAVVVGDDFRFGARRAGTPQLLRNLLREHNVDLEVIAPIPNPIDSAKGQKLSSTDIRLAIDEGRVGDAGIMLGRWHSVAGRVVHGDKRGRELGYPTANIDFENAYLPPRGIYASTLAVWDPRAPDHGAVWAAASSIGSNPTFVEDGPTTLEVHVIDRDLSERLYGMEVEVSFIERLRPETKFDDAAALVAQIEQDIARARRYVSRSALERVVPPDGTVRVEQASRT